MGSTIGAILSWVLGSEQIEAGKEAQHVLSNIAEAQHIQKDAS
jgi:hypothetical protein